MAHYFILGPVPGTMHTRYAVLAGDHTVTSIQISRPDGVEVERPAGIRWRIVDRKASARNWEPPPWNERGPLNPQRHNGEQPRRPVWKRAGRTASNVEAA